MPSDVVSERVPHVREANVGVSVAGCPTLSDAHAERRVGKRERSNTPTEIPSVAASDLSVIHLVWAYTFHR